MSTRSGAGNDTAELMTHGQGILLRDLDQQTDADGHLIHSGKFVSRTANNNRSWRWKLLRSGLLRFNFCIGPLSDRAIKLSSVVLYGNYSSSTWVVLTEKGNIGQPRYQSGDFSIANSLPGWDEVLRGNRRYSLSLRVKLVWTEAEVNAAPIPVNPAQLCVQKLQYNKVMEGGDIVYELVSSDGQSFCVNVTILQAKSSYFKRFFATVGWKEQADGRMKLSWTSAAVRQLIHYVYLNEVDGNICDLLPDLLDAAQMWELIGMKSLIEAQMKVRLQKAARYADTDTAVEYLKMAHLHQLTSLVPLCNGILAANFDRFFDSGSCKQMINSSEFCQLVKAIVHHIRNTHN